jgi:hypothetical protein
MADLGRCPSYGARIRWGITAAKGRAIPLDPDPSPTGNAWFDDAGRVHVLGRQQLLFQPPDLPQVRYVPHYATCPSYRRQDPQRALERTESSVARAVEAVEGEPVPPEIDAELRELAPHLAQTCEVKERLTEQHKEREAQRAAREKATKKAATKKGAKGAKAAATTKAAPAPASPKKGQAKRARFFDR